MRYAFASLVAPVIALLIPILGAIGQLYAEVEILPDGSPDDAPMRGAGLFLVMVVPALYFIGTVFYALVGHVLARFNLLNKRSALLVAACAPWPFVFLALLGLILNNRNYAVPAAVLLLIGAASSAFAAMGSLVWWHIAVGRKRVEA